ncbi:MAG: DUF1576 domain-containing protein [Bacillota bacterium]
MSQDQNSRVGGANVVDAPKQVTQRKLNAAILSGYMLALVVVGILLDPGGVVPGLGRIITSPSILITDYVVVGGPAAAMVNAGLVGLAGILMVLISGEEFRGLAIAGVFTMAGFAFFGKNVVNIWPTILGVWLYTKAVGEPFRKHLGSALFGTALSPLVSQLAVNCGLGPLVGFAVGTGAGVLLPPIALHLYPTHRGLCLYNTGFAAGIVGTAFVAVLRSLGLNFKPVFIWGTGLNSLTVPLIGVYVGSLVLVGRLCSGSWRKWRELQLHKGTLPSDFVDGFDFGTVLMNMGLVGLLGLAYVTLVRGELNGPTIGGILTMVGFGAFGKHVRNCLHVMLGVLVAALVSVWQPSHPGPLLAALFGTNLAPIAGMFGPLAGFLAGSMHLAVVMNIVDLHGGVNLYNNGFSGGIVATLLAAVLFKLAGDGPSGLRAK